MIALPRMVIVVGAGGVGKTTIAAALGVLSARSGARTLAMTFDPSRRLKDSLGIGDAQGDREAPVGVRGEGSLHASLLDARATFDRLVRRHAPDETTSGRILGNRYYHHLSGNLAGVLEYMAVERLYEVETEGKYERIVLDTPPTHEALALLEAPDRLVDFLDSGVLEIVARTWFDAQGRLRPTRYMGPFGRGVERYLDRVVGLDLLRDMAEFARAFGPLYAGFRRRAESVRGLLADAETLFLLVTGPGRERIPETMFFARHLAQKGFRVEPLIVNRVHPRGEAGPSAPRSDLVAWLGERDQRGVEALSRLVDDDLSPLAVPLLATEPSDLEGVEGVATVLEKLVRGRLEI